MNLKTKLGTLAGAVLMISSGVFAQHTAAPARGSMPPPARVTMRTTLPPSRPAAAPRAMPVRSPGSVTVIGANPNQSFTIGLPTNVLGNGVPGLGFDYPHLAAVSGNLGVMAMIDPATQANLALAERLARISPPVGGFFPVFDSGYSGYPVATEEQPQQAQPPQVIILQQPAAAPAAYEAPAETAAAPATSPASTMPDVGTFILVKKDGTQVEAGAYSRQGDRIVYVTPKGAKRTMLYSELDRDATREINQERGTSLEL